MHPLRTPPFLTMRWSKIQAALKVIAADRAVRLQLSIRVLHRHGKGVREIARETGRSRNTVRRYLRDEQAVRYTHAVHLLAKRRSLND